MENKTGILKALKHSIKKTKHVDELSVIISNRYQTRLSKVEKENKVMLDKLILATKGKEIFIENNRSGSF